MAYNLPPAWDAGYALPDNVQDEGLERRAFVTKWMPRGTYDQPRVATGGYVVPRYVRDEGYGQGTFTTKWMPRGTYNGPRVPQWIQRQPNVVAQRSLPGATDLTFQVRGARQLAMGDDAPLPELYENYGARAAAVILGKIANVIPSKRKQALRQIMDSIDPSLWNRTAEITRRYVSRGMTAGIAFQRGLARALSAGIAAEIITTGASRRAPQPNSLLGLGCYGCGAAPGAMGATPPIFGVKVTPKSTTPVVETTSNRKDPNRRYFTAGPFEFEDKIGATVTYHATDTPAAVKTAVLEALAKVTKIYGGSSAGMELFCHKQTGVIPKLFANTPDAPVCGKYIHGDLDGQSELEDPIMTLKRPGDSTVYGIFIGSVGTTARPHFTLMYSKIAHSKIGAVVSGLSTIIATSGDIVDTTIKELGNLACAVATSPAGVAAGGAAGVAAGGPAGAQAGAAGASIAAGMCGAAPMPPMVLPPQSSGILPVAIAAGVGLLAVALLKKKRKAATP